MWRNQERDLSLLYSLLDDLKQYWQWKAVKWEKIAHEIKRVRTLPGYTPHDEDEDEEAILRRTLMGDDDYSNLYERLKIELPESKDIFEFLDYEIAEEMDAIDLDAALIPNELLEPVIEDIEWLIPVCKAHIYPLKHMRAFLKNPRKWLKDYYER